MVVTWNTSTQDQRIPKLLSWTTLRKGKNLNISVIAAFNGQTARRLLAVKWTVASTTPTPSTSAA